MKPVLAVIILVTLIATGRAGETSTAAEYRPFHTRADHPWNQLHAALWLQVSRTAEIHAER